MDPATLREQIALLHDACFAWALHCCDRDREEADEVLQSAYLKVLDGRARFDGRSSLRTWLFAVIRRSAADARRRHVLRWLRFRPLERHDAPAEAADADAPALANERASVLARALAALPTRQREVLLLVFYHGHTVDDAGTVLGIGAGSARVHYARGKQRLRALLSRSRVLDDDRA